VVVPCEGTGYEIGGVSIIKGARNLENAKLFVDWALSKEAQELTWKKGEAYSILTNSTAEQSPYALDLTSSTHLVIKRLRKSLEPYLSKS